MQSREFEESHNSRRLSEGLHLKNIGAKRLLRGWGGRQHEGEFMVKLPHQIRPLLFQLLKTTKPNSINPVLTFVAKAGTALLAVRVQRLFNDGVCFR